MVTYVLLLSTTNGREGNEIGGFWHKYLCQTLAVVVNG